MYCGTLLCCIQWLKDTNLKANHNMASSKFEKIGCFQWFKDTNLKANHNSNLIIIGLKITK